MSGTHLLTVSDEEHLKVFAEVPMVCFRRAENLKDISVIAKVHPVKKNRSFGGRCKKSIAG